MSAENIWRIRLLRQGSPLMAEREIRSLPCPKSQATEAVAKKTLKNNYFSDRDADAVQIVDNHGNSIFTYTVSQLLCEPTMYQRGVQAYRDGCPRDDLTETFDRAGEWEDWLSGWDHGKAASRKN